MELIKLFKQLKKTPQRKDYHPEGDVLTHTLLVLGQALENNEPDEILFTALFHDFGKIDTLKYKEDGTPTAFGHEIASLKYAKKFVPSNLQHDVLMMIEEHMRYARLDEMRVSKQEALLKKMGKLNKYMEKFVVYDDMPLLFSQTTEDERELLIIKAINYIADFHHGTVYYQSDVGKK